MWNSFSKNVKWNFSYLFFYFDLDRTGDAWLKSIGGTAIHTSLDIFVLLLMCGMVNFQKNAMSLFTKKIKLGYISVELIDNTFKRHSRALGDYFKQLVVSFKCCHIK